MTKATARRSVWAAILTPQGKWFADFFIYDTGEAFLLDVDVQDASDIITHLSKFRLRAKIIVSDLSSLYSVYSGWNTATLDQDYCSPDPRLPNTIWRACALGTTIAVDATFEDWDSLRIREGLPDGRRDLDRGASLLLEAGFDRLDGISWDKGCYMGQEITARTRYRGLVKRQLVPVRVHGPLPPRNSPVLLDGHEVGEMRSGRGDVGLALIRLGAALQSAGLECGTATLEVLNATDRDRSSVN